MVAHMTLDHVVQVRALVRQPLLYQGLNLEEVTSSKLIIYLFSKSLNGLIFLSSVKPERKCYSYPRELEQKIPKKSSPSNNKRGINIRLRIKYRIKVFYNL